MKLPYMVTVFQQDCTEGTDPELAKIFVADFLLLDNSNIPSQKVYEV